MAFSLKFGGLMKQAASHPGPVPMTSMMNYIRCMSSKLFVGGLSLGIDECALTEAFSGYGDLVDVEISMDRETGWSRGFGFVEFAYSALSAMDGQDLGGRNIRLSVANERPSRSFGGGGGVGYRTGGGGDDGGF